MSRTNGQDYYLQNLPSNLNNYGLNKTLITRALSIDWKHRDTKITYSRLSYKSDFNLPKHLFY